MENGKKENEEGFVLLRKNRRKNLRKQLLVLKVRGEDDKGVFFGYAKTISRDGMFIASVNPKKLGEEFRISFALPDSDIKVSAVATVIWCREYDPTLKTEPGMGIKFLDLNEEIKARIDEWVKKR